MVLLLSEAAMTLTQAPLLLNHTRYHFPLPQPPSLHAPEYQDIDILQFPLQICPTSRASTKSAGDYLHSAARAIQYDHPAYYRLVNAIEARWKKPGCALEEVLLQNAMGNGAKGVVV